MPIGIGNPSPINGMATLVGALNKTKHTIEVNNPTPRYNPEHIKEMAATVFGEATSNKDEMRAMIDTVLNRRNQLGLDIRKVLTQKDGYGEPMYRAYGGKEYDKYMSNNLKLLGEPEKKKMLDELINELQYGKWEPSEYTNFDQAPNRNSARIGEHYFRKEFQGNRK